jgi:hypothetical protein
MTEYITKEQAEKIARSQDVVDLHYNLASHAELSEVIYRAINLAFEQRLEVVGYAYTDTLKASIPIVKDGQGILFVKGSEFQDSTPLYALKGDSK